MKITIARQCGSGGHEVAEALAEKLNLEIFDKKRFVEEAKKRNVYDENDVTDIQQRLRSGKTVKSLSVNQNLRLPAFY